mgnify:CR=1 FL=1
MITVKLKKNSNRIKNITIIGHALYDDYGKDIVCAAVSSISILTINNIIKIDNEAISYSNDNKLEINILKDNEIINILIDNLVNCLKELEHDYPKNITIKEDYNE